MKRWSWLLVIYVVVHATRGDILVEYEGLEPQAVAQMVQDTYGAPYEVITPERYQSLIQAKPRPGQPPRAPR